MLDSKTELAVNTSYTSNIVKYKEFGYLDILSTKVVGKVPL